MHERYGPDGRPEKQRDLKAIIYLGDGKSVAYRVPLGISSTECAHLHLRGRTDIRFYFEGTEENFLLRTNHLKPRGLEYSFRPGETLYRVLEYGETVNLPGNITLSVSRGRKGSPSAHATLVLSPGWKFEKVTQQ